MALDHALMRRAARTGESVIRVYAWSRPTLSFGRNEPAFSRAGLDIVRRPTGGRMILHHRELTYSFTLPAAERPRATYERLNGILAATLTELGVPVTIATDGVTRTHGPCFAAPSPGELIYQGRKIAGSAQWRENGVILQHGSILVDNDQGGLDAATLREALGRAPSASELAEAFAKVVDCDIVTFALEPMVRAEAKHLCSHYIDDAWTWRRKA